MDKLINILSELPTTNEYISSEIDEIEQLSHRVAESVTTNRNNSDETQHKIKQIENLNVEEQSLYKKIRDREKEFAMSMRKLEDLQSEYESLATIDDNDFGSSDNDILKNLEYTMKLFGMDVKAHYIEPTVYQAKISFTENKYVIFNCDIIRNTYELHAMEPMHKHYEEMRRLLQESRDIVGFLSHVWKYFGQEG